MNPSPNDWLSPVQVARMFGFSSGETVLKWQIPRMEIPRPDGKKNYRFRRSDVEAFQEKHTVNAA